MAATAEPAPAPQHPPSSTGASAQDRPSPPPQKFPLPRILTYPSSAPAELVTQGAEARLYRTTHAEAGVAAALKYRPAKAWRHPALDARLTRHRILAEARILARCRREGVRVPAVYALDDAAGWLALEWIPGPPVRAAINRWLDAERRRRGEDETRDAEVEGEGEGKVAELRGDTDPLVRLMRRMGEAVGRLHKVGVVHGDLTTSNMMLRRPAAPPGDGNDDDDDDDAQLDGEIVIIDFGLASQGTADEDRAVDLYVLERAFASTHPRAEPLFAAAVLGAYAAAFRQAPAALRKLEDVRLRGRKRSMLG